MSFQGTELAAAVLDAATRLSEKDDETALAEVLLAAVTLHASAGGVRLLCLSNEACDTEFDATNVESALVRDLFGRREEPRHVREDGQLAECVRSQQTLSRVRADGVKRLVMPVWGERSVMQLLVIDGLRELRLTEPLLEMLVRIYANQLLHVMRKERDPLTGLYNRHSFGERVRKAAIGAAETRRRASDPRQSSLSLAMIDIDHFKQVNDRYGHVYGDEVLILFARLMVRSFRADDLLFRYGGEEFVAILPGVGGAAAAGVLERFRAAVEAFDVPRVGRMSASIGLTEIEPNDLLQDIVGRADQALYYAKDHGRNRVCSYEMLLASGDLAPSKIEVGDVELF